MMKIRILTINDLVLSLLKNLMKNQKYMNNKFTMKILKLVLLIMNNYHSFYHVQQFIQINVEEIK